MCMKSLQNHLRLKSAKHKVVKGSSPVRQGSQEEGWTIVVQHAFTKARSQRTGSICRAMVGGRPTRKYRGSGWQVGYWTGRVYTKLRRTVWRKSDGRMAGPGNPNVGSIPKDTQQVHCAFMPAQ